MLGNLSIKDAPDEFVERLRTCAARHHCSLQRELSPSSRKLSGRQTKGRLTKSWPSSGIAPRARPPEQKQRYLSARTAMAIEVADASALAALLFWELAAERIAERLRDGLLVAPASLNLEIANICLTRIRRHPEQRAVLLHGLHPRGCVAIEIVAVDHRQALASAETSGLATYDGSYPRLAQRLGAKLVTLPTVRDGNNRSKSTISAATCRRLRSTC